MLSLTRPARRGVLRTALASLVAATAVTAAVAVVADPAGAASAHAPHGRVTRLYVHHGVAYVRGWAYDRDTTRPATVTLRFDHGARHHVHAWRWSSVRHDHTGFYAKESVPEGTHRLCVRVVNAGGGPSTRLRCATVSAHYIAPGAPTHVRVARSYYSLTLHWRAPHHHGGGPLHHYRVRVTGSRGHTYRASAVGTAHGVTVRGLPSERRYTVRVRASNEAYRSRWVTLHTSTTQAPIPPQRTPAPMSRSHYLRALTGNTAHDTAAMQRMGAADGAANVGGHRYLVLQDIGAQTGGGVVLSATTTYITYAELVTALRSYIAGYASAQHRNAPVTVAVGTNNDGSVSRTQGEIWAEQVVNPLRSWARAHTQHLGVAGADDMEPGFAAGPHATSDWLSGFLSATSATFVFNGSADGCSTVTTSTGCNNGWTTTVLHSLAGGASPGRIVALPQIYNTVMPWHVISARGTQRLRFGGPLTERRACAQAGSCSSLSSGRAWSLLFGALGSDSRTSVYAMPYGPDLRID